MGFPRILAQYKSFILHCTVDVCVNYVTWNNSYVQLFHPLLRDLRQTSTERFVKPEVVRDFSGLKMSLLLNCIASTNTRLGRTRSHKLLPCCLLIIVERSVHVLCTKQMKRLPTVESSRVESSRVESSRVESSRVESSRVESSRVESSRVESSRVESSRVESSRVESSRVESSRVYLSKYT